MELHYWYIFVFTIILTFLLYKYIFDFDYWKRKGVPCKKPLPVVGNVLELVLLKVSIYELATKLYKESNAPFIGMYIFNKPCFIPKTPELIQSILVKDFDYFSERSVLSDKKYDSMVAHMLASVKTPQWKVLRTKLSPTFTAGKVKKMFKLMEMVANDLTVYLENNSEHFSLEAKELSAKYTTDLISSCAFGIDAHCFEQEDSQFRQAGRRLLDFTWRTAGAQAAYFLAPIFVKIFRFPFFHAATVDYMRDVFWTTLRAREESKVVRNDVIDSLIKLKSQTHPLVSFEGDGLAAQAFQFFVAGYETTSTLLAFALYMMSLHPDIQDKLRKEIQAVLLNHGDFSFEALQEMKYLHYVLCETMRKYPPIPFINRNCVKEYKIPNSDVVVDAGTSVLIPIFALHNDPVYFEEPDKFIPERFSNNKHFQHAYFPFGTGPRICIGELFGMVAAKLGLATIISKYSLEPCDDTPIPIRFESKCFLLASKDGLPLKFTKLTT